MDENSGSNGDMNGNDVRMHEQDKMKRERVIKTMKIESKHLWRFWLACCTCL